MKDGVLCVRARLDLAEFRVFNVERSEAPKDCGGFGHKIEEWSPAEWGNALAGEVGELCNLLKKIRRGDNVDMMSVGDEASDVLAYLDLATASVGLSLAQATVRKWDFISLQRGYEKLLSSRKLK